MTSDLHEAQQLTAAKICGTPFRAAGMQAELLRAKSLTGLRRPPSPASSIVANPFQVDWGIPSLFTRTPLDLFLQCSRQLSSLARSLFDFPTYLTDVPRCFI